MAKRKILFVDRDGTLIEEPEDHQVDSLEKVRLMPDVIPALLRFRESGYELVIVSNQDGLGTDSFPQADFEAPHSFMLHVFDSQGIVFDDILIDPTFEHENALTRKPGIGLVLDYLKSGDLDLQRSAVVGDRETDLQLADNMGIAGFRVGAQGQSWSEITAAMLDAPRKATVQRKTKETDISVEVNLDQPGTIEVSTGLGFYDHMLEQLGKHGGFSMSLTCKGDLHIDEHHTVEDTALALGQALREALGDKLGIHRYGFVLPMDEANVQASIDLSGRPYAVYEGDLGRDQVGQLSTEMVPHFFRSLAETLRAAIHIEVKGDNTHHMIEASFKGLARCFRQAFARDGAELPSTKGML